MKRLLILVLFSAVGCCRCSDNLDRICKKLFPYDEPGAAVLVMIGDSVVFDRGYGLADIGTKAKIDGNTFFNIASVSKQFTAVAIMQLQQMGKLSIDDPVSKYFPKFEADFWKDITIGQLMSHSSGIPDARYYSREEKIYGDEALSVSYMDTLSYVHFAPGSAYEYINPTYVLLGYIVEKVSGQLFTEYMDEHVFQPAGMSRTLYFDRDHQDRIPNMAHGYAKLDAMPRAWVEYDFGEETFFATRPDGGIYTSTREFAQWERTLRNAVVLSRESIEDAQSPHTLVSGSPWSDYQNRPNTWYGYGWFIEPATDSTDTVVYHTGDNGGFKIIAARYPDSEALVLIFANRADWDRYSLLQQVESIYGL